MFERDEQLRESGFEATVTPQLITEEDRGEDGPAPFGVGLEVSDPLPVGGGEAHQPQNQGGQRSDEQQGLEALGALRSSVAQHESEAGVLEVANRFLDLHALGIDALDSSTRPAMMGQGGSRQPRSAVHLSILRTTHARPARSSAPGAHQIQPAPVPVLARQTSPADVAHPRGGLSVKRVDIAPASRFWAQVPDAVTNPPNPVPTERLDITKPRAAESRIGGHDGTTALGENGLQFSNKLIACMLSSLNPNGSVVTTIRSDDSMHVDPLSNCISYSSSRNS